MHKLIFLVALFSLTGCRLDVLSLAPLGPVGHYSLDLARTGESMKAIAEAEAQKQQGAPEESQETVEERTKQAMAMLSAFKMDITLKEDGTWKGSFYWGPLGQTSTGTWEQREDKLFLTTLQEDGKDLPRPEIQEAIYRGGEIHLTTEDISTGLILTRSPA